MLLFALWYVYHLAITTKKVHTEYCTKHYKSTVPSSEAGYQFFSLSWFTNSVAILSPSTSTVCKNNYNYSLHLQLTMLENTPLFLHIKLPLCLLTTSMCRCCKGGNNFYRFLLRIFVNISKGYLASFACSFMSQPCTIYIMSVKW